MVEYLKANGGNVNAVHGYALEWASYRGHLDVVKFLLDNGATDGINCALRWAAGQGHLNVVKILVERGAGERPWALRWANENSHKQVVEYLQTKPPAYPGSSF